MEACTGKSSQKNRGERETEREDKKNAYGANQYTVKERE